MKTLKRFPLSVTLMLTGLPSLFAANLVVSDYLLSENQYDKIKLEEVYDGTFDINKWWSDVNVKNSKVAKGISGEKIATIEVKCSDLFDDLGADEPFLIEGRRRAAYLGANVLEYKSGVVNKNTERIQSETFLAYRFTFEKNVLSPADFSRLETEKIEINPDVFEAFRVMCGRAPTIGEGQFFSSKIASGETDLNGLERFLMLSPEALKRVAEGTGLHLKLNDGTAIDGSFNRFDEAEGVVWLKIKDPKSKQNSFPLNTISAIDLQN